MDETTREAVRERASNYCEYCLLHQDDSPLAKLHIEHIVPKKHGGSDELSDLALACIDCNLHKGSNLTGIDPATGQLTPLFHPRQHSWEAHFDWNGSSIEGKTALEINSNRKAKRRNLPVS